MTPITALTVVLLTVTLYHILRLRREVKELSTLITEQEVSDAAALLKEQRQIINDQRALLESIQADDEADKAKIAELTARAETAEEKFASVAWLDKPELDAALDEGLGRTQPTQ